MKIYRWLSTALLAATFMLVSLVPQTLTAQISVIVNKANTTKLNESDFKDFFAGAKLTWPSGEKVQVADQSSTDTGKTFYKSFLSKSVNQIRMQWTKLVLSGQAIAPVKCQTDAEVKKAVAANKDAIGFILTSELDDTVKEALKIEPGK